MDSDNDQNTDNKTSQNLRKPVFSFKQTQEAAQTNSQILVTINENLGSAI